MNSINYFYLEPVSGVLTLIDTTNLQNINSFVVCINPDVLICSFLLFAVCILLLSVLFCYLPCVFHAVRPLLLSVLCIPCCMSSPATCLVYSILCPILSPAFCIHLLYVPFFHLFCEFCYCMFSSLTCPMHSLTVCSLLSPALCIPCSSIHSYKHLNFMFHKRLKNYYLVTVILRIIRSDTYPFWIRAKGQGVFCVSCAHEKSCRSWK